MRTDARSSKNSPAVEQAKPDVGWYWNKLMIISAIFSAGLGSAWWVSKTFAKSSTEEKRAVSEAKDVDDVSAAVKEMHKAHQEFIVSIVGLEKDSEWIKEALGRLEDKQRIDVSPTSMKLSQRPP